MKIAVISTFAFAGVSAKCADYCEYEMKLIGSDHTINEEKEREELRSLFCDRDELCASCDFCAKPQHGVEAKAARNVVQETFSEPVSSATFKKAADEKVVEPMKFVEARAARNVVQETFSEPVSSATFKKAADEKVVEPMKFVEARAARNVVQETASHALKKVEDTVHSKETFPEPVSSAPFKKAVDEAVEPVKFKKHLLCDPNDCHNWSCDRWCFCFNVYPFLSSSFPANMCNEGGDACDCEGATIDTDIKEWIKKEDFTHLEVPMKYVVDPEFDPLPTIKKYVVPYLDGDWVPTQNHLVHKNMKPFLG